MIGNYRDGGREVAIGKSFKIWPFPEELLAASALLTGGLIPRVIKTRGAPLPVALASAGIVTGSYYTKKWYDFTYTK